MSDAYPVFASLSIEIERGVVFVAIKHPPMNILDAELLRQLRAFARWFESQRELLVVVFRSADPHFFIAHADLELLRNIGATPARVSERLSPLNELAEWFRRMPKVSIAQIEGFARGGGSEFALGLDMRFAAVGKAVLSQPEAALRLIPGGGGTQRLPQLVGRSRALEILLGCDDFSAEEAERFGYVNRALPVCDIAEFVRSLAFRIAQWAPEVIDSIKRAVDFGVNREAGLRMEDSLFDQIVRHPETRDSLQRALHRGAQTREAESGRFLDLCNVKL